MKIMTQEEKQLLFKDLCARLPYGVVVERTYMPENNGYTSKLTAYTLDLILDDNWSVKPYLRPMESMTAEEMKTFPYPYYFDWIDTDRKTMCSNDECSPCLDFDDINDVTDWLNEHHFDYRGLIEKGLALEAPEGMYYSTGK